jgi:hypothetical protein
VDELYRSLSRCRKSFNPSTDDSSNDFDQQNELGQSQHQTCKQDIQTQYDVSAEEMLLLPEVDSELPAIDQHQSNLVLHK